MRYRSARHRGLVFAVLLALVPLLHVLVGGGTPGPKHVVAVVLGTTLLVAGIAGFRERPPRGPGSRSRP